MPQTIMVFGAGLNQLTLIEAARELGLRSVVVDPAEHPPGKGLADLFYQVGRDDYAGTKDIALKHKVDGLVTGQMENPLKLMAKLAEDLDLIFPSPEIVERATNKYLMKQAFMASGVPCARGVLIENNKVLCEEEFSSHKTPLIIKPLQAFSSRGVFRVDSFAQYLQKIEATLSFAPDGNYLIEEFVEGPEYSAESITYMGRTAVVQYTEKLITPYPETVELGHFQPAELCDEQIDEIDQTVKKAVKALGIDNSAGHTELKWTAKGPVVIEVGPRLGGDFISSCLTLASTGVNMDRAAIQTALGQDPDLRPTKNIGAAIMYLALPSGRVVTAVSEDINKVGDIPGVIKTHLDIKPGDIIPPLTDSAKRCGWAIVCGKTNREAKQLASEVIGNLLSCISLSGDESHPDRSNDVKG